MVDYSLAGETPQEHIRNALTMLPNGLDLGAILAGEISPLDVAGCLEMVRVRLKRALEQLEARPAAVAPCADDGTASEGV